MRVRWTRGALRDLESAFERIARDRPGAASRVATKIHDAVARLAEHPKMGRPGRIPGTRELIVPGLPYIVPYRIRDEIVEILSVFHAARKWPESF
jgi:toxin ParE1/3/4